MTTHATRKRSLVKAVSYRVIIVSLDFAVIYLLTGKAEVAVGFMVVSNIYTTVGYFLHERLWARVKWGMEAAPSQPDLPDVRPPGSFTSR
jgi:adenylylsulfate kinase